MTQTDFDPTAILNDPLSHEEADGKRPLTPEGSYPDAMITSVEPFEPNEQQQEKGVQARLLIKFECDASDVDLATWMNYKRPLHPKATYAKLVKAVWPDKSVAEGKAPNDLHGENINITVFHEDGPSGNPYAEFRFTPCT